MEYLVADSATSTSLPTAVTPSTSTTPAIGVGSCTVAGPRRAANQDAVLAGPTWFVVADGVGGRGGGEVASRLAVERFRAAPAPTCVDDLVATVAAVDDAIRDRAGLTRTSGMATTVVGVVAVAGVPTVFHVGDSRCYDVTVGSAVQLTRDHSHVQELVDAGVLSTAAAACDPRRNMITRALGVAPASLPDIAPVERRGQLVLCSDGVSSVLTPAAIADVVVGAPGPQSAADALVAAALAAGSTDDATALVIDRPPSS